jgi:serine/threonine-protein kinase
MVVDSSGWSGVVANDAAAQFDFADRYEPCFEIASGGMATVYLARATSGAGVHRFVALKRIHPHLVGDKNFREMFVDEAQVVSRISHPNVCSVFDFEASGDSYFIAMEYLMGEPLSRVRSALVKRGGPGSLRESCLIARIVAEACEGLHAAHELKDSSGDPLKVVHRDVSPQNLFVTYDGAVKVVDFGLVRSERRHHKTKTGMVKGKFAYVAPEAIAMKRLDRRVDVWGLGVVLWEMLTLRRLFQRDSEIDTLLAVGTAEVKPPSRVRKGVPPALDAIVLRALARDPAERYSSARELAKDLLRFLHAAPDPVGMGDLSCWLEELFPRGRDRKQQLLEIASQIERQSRPPRASDALGPTWPPPPPRPSGSWRSGMTARRSSPPPRSLPPMPRLSYEPTWAGASGSLYAAQTQLMPARRRKTTVWSMTRKRLRTHGVTAAAVALSVSLGVALFTTRSTAESAPRPVGTPLVLQPATQHELPGAPACEGASCSSQAPLGTYVLELPPTEPEAGGRRLVVQVRPATPDAVR